MQSPIKHFLVYDFETGGLKKDCNPITEAAIVVVSNETLEIVEEFSVMFRPRLDLSSMNESGKKESKRIFESLSVKDEEDNIKKMRYKDIIITPRTQTILAEEIEEFREFLIERDNITDKGFIIEYEEYLEIKQTKFSDIVEVFYNLCYNSQALEITHMSTELMLAEGVSYEEGFNQFKAIIEKYTIGMNKPVLAGHNIRDFDNPFLEKLFSDNGADINKLINKFMIDTLDWCRSRWFELSSFSLGVCANALGLTLKEAHRALPDTIANAKVLIALLKNMRGEGQGEVEYVRKKYNYNY